MNDIVFLKKYCNALSILYVEDDEALRASVLRYLQKLFQHIDTANDGEEGLEKYKSAQYDIVLTDIKMPKMDGLGMTKEIKAINPKQEIIILSAHTETDFFLNSIHMGVSDYIIKPIDYEQMNSVLYKIANNLHIHRENLRYQHSLHELVVEQTQEMADNYEQTLKAMVDMIEGRDSYTGGHSERVATYCKAIAKEMGRSEEECQLIYRAGMLHDVGKVTTPDTILLKPGQLSDREYGLIQHHVTASHQLLSKIPMYHDLSNIIISHHERYDGSGYPKGLKGDEIPLLAHIMIIADAFDAMTTSRIYKGRKTQEDAISEIIALSGKQFHPDIIPFASKALSKATIADNITQLPKNTMEKERFAYFFRDHVSDAYNKEYLELYLQQVPEEYNVCVCFLKHFSQYNTKAGWDAGDALLKEFARHLQETYPDAMVFRIHGDDFVLISESTVFDQCDSYNQAAFLKDTGVTLSHHSLSSKDDIMEQIKRLDTD
ncbi:HD domain-containing phosphohydrolase [Campylobacterota bacterium]